jgi:hypothetical protein
MQEARWGRRRPDPSAAQASHGTPTRMDPLAARPRLGRHRPASQCLTGTHRPAGGPAAARQDCPESPKTLLVTSARTGPKDPSRPPARGGRPYGPPGRPDSSLPGRPLRPRLSRLSGLR